MLSIVQAIIHLHHSFQDPSMLGFWPLDSQYGGADLSGNNNHMILHEFIQHPTGVEFLSTPESFGEITTLHPERKFSWFCSLTLGTTTDAALIEWQSGMQIWVLGSKLYVHVLYISGCHVPPISFNPLSAGQFYNLAVSVDVANSEVTMWINEDQKTVALSPCDSDLRTTGTAYVGIR